MDPRYTLLIRLRSPAVADTAVDHKPAVVGTAAEDIAVDHRPAGDIVADRKPVAEGNKTESAEWSGL